MVTPINEVPVAVDYTSRDYYSLRADLIQRVQSNINVPGTGVSWSGSDPTDFGVALVEAFAFMGDSINYYIDRIANENFITTATQRKSILNLAKTYGYTPAGYRGATLELTFFNSSLADVTVPAGTQVSGQVVFNDTVTEVIFTTTEDTVVPASGQIATSAVVQGEYASTVAGNDTSYGELVGYSDGTPNQVFVLSQNQVVSNSVQVFVEVGNGVTYNLWKQVTRVIESAATDAVYSTDTDEDNFVSISFGDGVSGAIPTQGASIKVNYLIGGGLMGNISAGVIDTIRRTAPGVDLSAITVTNSSSGTGGSDPESNDSIRKNAPAALSALNRAVTLADYANIALGVPNVGKANATAETKSSVTLYIAPQQSSTSTDLYPGYTGDPATGGVLTSDWNTLVESVNSYLSEKTQIGVTTTVTQPTYVPVHLLLHFTPLSQYSADQVKANILLSLINAFSYQNLRFADNISPEEVEFQVRQVEGVYTAKVLALYVDGETGRNTLIGGPGQIFVFDEANLDVFANSTDSSLSALTASSGTLTPAFSSTQLNYNLPIPNGTTSVDITPTNSTAVITVNGTVTASGTSHTVATPVGITTVTVNVTAEDSVSTSSYKVTITRAS